LPDFQFCFCRNNPAKGLTSGGGDENKGLCWGSRILKFQRRAEGGGQHKGQHDNAKLEMKSRYCRLIIFISK